METSKIEWCKVYINYDCNGITQQSIFSRFNQVSYLMAVTLLSKMPTISIIDIFSDVQKIQL
jgi:hypothetical protein